MCEKTEKPCPSPSLACFLCLFLYLSTDNVFLLVDCISQPCNTTCGAYLRYMSINKMIEADVKVSLRIRGSQKISLMRLS